MASTITVTPQELRKIAEELRQYNESYKRQLEEMVAIMNALNTKWEGSAKEAFNRKFEERATSFDVFYSAIQGYCSVLLNIAERYESVDRRNAALVSSGGAGAATSNAGIQFEHRILPGVECSLMYGSPYMA